MPEVVGALFCDDVRQETNGKQIFIGLYTGQMVINHFPWQGKLTPVLFTRGMDTAEKMSLSIGSADGAIFAEAQIELELLSGSSGGFTMLPLPPVQLNLSSDTEVQISASFDGDPLSVVGTLKIARGNAADVLRTLAKHLDSVQGQPNALIIGS